MCCLFSHTVHTNWRGCLMPVETPSVHPGHLPPSLYDIFLARTQPACLDDPLRVRAAKKSTHPPCLALSQSHPTTAASRLVILPCDNSPSFRSLSQTHHRT